MLLPPDETHTTGPAPAGRPGRAGDRSRPIRQRRRAARSLSRLVGVTHLDASAELFNPFEGAVDTDAMAANAIVTAKRATSRARLPIALAVGDACWLALAGLAAAAVHRPTRAIEVWWVLGFSLTTLVALHLRGFYSFRLGGSILAELGRILTATTLAAMILLSATVLLGDTSGAGALGVQLWACATVFLGAARTGMGFAARRSWVAHGAGVPTLVIGAGRVGRVVAQRLRDRPELGLRPVGHIDDEPFPARPDDLPLLGGTRDLERVIAANHVRQVIFTFSRDTDERLLTVMRRCKRLGVDISVVPRLYEEMTHRVSIEHVGAVPLLRVEQPDPRGWMFAAKYATDRPVAALLLLLLAPVLAVIALAVRLSSPGPIFFRQARGGRDDQEFKMLKFRTMRGDPGDEGEADASWAAMIRGETGSGIIPVDRTTPAGRILRRLSLDELPQLFNVLNGHMSLVGPRPERVGHLHDFEDLVYRYSERHRVKPGMTGWAQIHGLRGETSLQDRIEWDNYYIENWSPWLDLKILLRTLPTALRLGLSGDKLEPSFRVELQTPIAELLTPIPEQHPRPALAEVPRPSAEHKSPISEPVAGKAAHRA
jgi:exopolysaccharide biosynthesis polyprenyl glycosylphosphotransferase